MNMENNNVCNGGNCCKEGGCDHGNMMGHGCCGWKRCHMIKKIICVVIVIIAFCLGTQLGELKSMARYGGMGRGMLSWGCDNGSGWKSVKVDDSSAASKNTTQGTATTPKQ
jgi:hypothetical protein